MHEDVIELAFFTNNLRELVIREPRELVVSALQAYAL